MWLIFCFIWPSLSGASDSLSPRQIERLTTQIREYFSPARTADIQMLRALRPTFAVLQTVLRAARVEYEPLMADATSTLRAEYLLHVVSLKALEVEVPPAERNRRELREDLQYFLMRFQAGGLGHERVLELYDRWRLWQPEDFWFFETIQTPANLRIHASRIRFLLPQLSARQILDFAGQLRRIRPVALFQYVLLLETGEMRETELVRMLGLASLQFARSLDRRDLFDGDESYNLHALEDPVQRSVAAALRLVQAKLFDRDIEVGSAFDKAVANARRASNRDYNLENRLLFFKLLQESRLDWQDRSSWLPKAQQISRENIPLRHRYRVNGNVILVQFRAKSCEDKLNNG